MRPSHRDKIYAFLKAFYKTNGYPPSMAQIAAKLGLTSRANINHQLMLLTEEGRVTHIGGKYYPAGTAELSVARFRFWETSRRARRLTPLKIWTDMSAIFRRRIGRTPICSPSVSGETR